MSDEIKPLTEEQTARLKEQAREMRAWQRLVEFAHQGLALSAWVFQNSDCTKEEPAKGEVIPETAIYVLRDSEGKIVATDINGNLLHRNPEDEFVTGPFTVWAVNDSEILKQFPVWAEGQWRFA